MLLSLGSRAVCGSVSALLLAGTLITPLMAAAGDGPAQRQELAAALRQVEALERFIATSAASMPATAGGRYHFDYPRLQADLERVRAGIQDYLTPRRAQPRDPVVLLGDYRQPATPSVAATESAP